MAIFGNTSFKLQPGATYQVQRNGLAVYTETLKGDGAFSISQGASSARHPNTVLTELTVKYGEDGCDSLQVDLKYEGQDTRFTRPSIAADVTMETATALEPIDSHPRFKEFAGTPTAPLNGAVFDPKDGGFKYFAPIVSNAINPFAGIRSYYMPISKLTNNNIEQRWPTAAELDRVGKIQPPSGSAPNLPGGRNWLYVGVTVRNIGNIYFEIQRNYAASGPRKWNEDIYGEI